MAMEATARAMEAIVNKARDTQADMVVIAKDMKAAARAMEAMVDTT